MEFRQPWRVLYPHKVLGQTGRNIHPGSAVLHALNAQRTGQGTLVRALTVTIFTYLKSNLIKVLTSNHLEIVQVITEFAFTYEAEACYAPALNTHHKRITTAVAQIEKKDSVRTKTLIPFQEQRTNREKFSHVWQPCLKATCHYEHKASRNHYNVFPRTKCTRNLEPDEYDGEDVEDVKLRIDKKGIGEKARDDENGPQISGRMGKHHFRIKERCYFSCLEREQEEDDNDEDDEDDDEEEKEEEGDQKKIEGDFLFLSFL
ncbi:hypothetical protein RUM44_005254 [Polyplax serrata]|uniref:Uncharacterized protein n=1 Tax=Polyplax serrata TaxID=468196 RepID=A0ABR1AEY1_POLSC